MAADLYADYVIVGAGSAGCVLAARLTESGEHKVVLLEAGGDDRPLKEPGQFLSNIMIHTPIGFGKTLNDPKVNWLYETEVDEGSGGRKHKWPKGKVLGGSSSINGMLYVRGQSADYDGWAQMGARGWSWDEVLPYFRKSQNQERGACDHHGVGGANTDPLQHVSVDALVGFAVSEFALDQDVVKVPGEIEALDLAALALGAAVREHCQTMAERP